MTPFLPPESGSILALVAVRNARRARRLIGDLRGHARSMERREARRALERAFAALRGGPRASFLTRPEVRAWLSTTEVAVSMSLPRREMDDLALFDLVCRGPHLRRLLPLGRIDGGFRRRAAALGREMLERSFRRIPGLVAFLTPEDDRFLSLPIDAGQDAEEGRVDGEMHVAFPASLTLSRMTGARLTLLPHAIRVDGGRSPVRIVPRPTIRGSEIVLTRRAVSSRNGLRPGAHVVGLADRLGEALDLAHRAWPEAHAEILAHTKEVVPLVERGTVSYSLPERTGTSFINVWGKSLVDLADDLLHETAHHRLHDLEEIEGPLDRDDGEPRYRSPWRRSIRPLHGILHATYTFAWRAELMSRMASSGLPPGRRRRLRNEAAREWTRVARSLSDLRDAKARGLLTPAGVRLIGSIATRAES